MTIKLNVRDYIYIGFMLFSIVAGFRGNLVFGGMALGAVYGFVIYRLIK